MAFFDRLRAALDGTRGAAAGTPKQDALQLASAALLVHAARIDGTKDGAELDRLSSLLRDRFDLDEAEVEQLLSSAREAAERSPQLFGFTQTINARFSHEERLELIEMLWEVVYADGEVHAYEANLMRRIAGLLHVPDPESGDARKRVLKRRGQHA
jgi:uncharacterized tellurite resistance protein B-like protein